MIYASTFLSHSSVDKPLVELIAHELGRRGVISWLDKNELAPGVSLKKALKIAIQRQATVTLFLSHDALNSYWVNEELAIALEVDKETGNKDRIIPVFLGDPAELVSSHELLRKKWLSTDGETVDRLGIVIKKPSSDSYSSKQIADEIASKIYKTVKVAEKREAIIYLDQRGTGDRHGEYLPIPENLQESDTPILVFRPDLIKRAEDETLHGTEWKQFSSTMETALSKALEGVKWADRKKIHVLGFSQLGLPFLIGQIYNRNTSADLYCGNIDSPIFTNKRQLRHTPLQGGNPNCKTPHPEIQSIPPNAQLSSISLLLSTPYILLSVVRYLKEHPDLGPLVWVKNDLFSKSEQVMSYIADIVALLMRLRDKNHISTVNLFCGLPFNVLPLLSANLLHVVENIIFMEYRRDLQGKNPTPGEIYIPLKTKSG